MFFAIKLIGSFLQGSAGSRVLAEAKDRYLEGREAASGATTKRFFKEEKLVVDLVGVFGDLDDLLMVYKSQCAVKLFYIRSFTLRTKLVTSGTLHLQLNNYSFRLFIALTSPLRHCTTKFGIDWNTFIPPPLYI